MEDSTTAPAPKLIVVADTLTLELASTVSPAVKLTVPADTLRLPITAEEMESSLTVSAVSVVPFGPLMVRLVMGLLLGLISSNKEPVGVGSSWKSVGVPEEPKDIVSPKLWITKWTALHLGLPRWWPGPKSS